MDKNNSCLMLDFKHKIKFFYLITYTNSTTKIFMAFTRSIHVWKMTENLTESYFLTAMLWVLKIINRINN